MRAYCEDPSEQGIHRIGLFAVDRERPGHHKSGRACRSSQKRHAGGPRLREPIKGAGGGMSRAAKGADCKSAGYAFAGSSPASPTTSFRSNRILISSAPLPAWNGEVLAVHVRWRCRDQGRGPSFRAVLTIRFRHFATVPPENRIEQISERHGRRPCRAGFPDGHEPGRKPGRLCRLQRRPMKPHAASSICFQSRNPR